MALRDTLTAGLSADFSALATVAGVTSADAVWQMAVDNTYLAFGMTFPPDPDAQLSVQQISDAPWLAEYYALRSLVRQLAGKVDTETGVNKRKGSQAFANAQKLFAVATSAIEGRGYGVTEDFAYGRLNLDYLEPYYAPGVSGPWQ